MAQMIPATHRYIPRIDQRQKNLFKEEYYSSTDTQIFIDDLEQTEISYIGFSMQEQLLPLYGYNSRTFDDVAVGNRIVNGTMKVAIANPDAQTPFMDLVGSLMGDQDVWQQYNEAQKEKLDNSDWVGNPTGQIPYIDNEYNMSDDELYKYVSKLASLGYNIDSNASPDEIKAIIAKFQSEHGIESNGHLTDDTKVAIDMALDSNGQKTITIPMGTTVYSGPGDIFDVLTVLSSDTRAYVIQEFADNWKLIRTDDGGEGYVQI